MSYSTAYDDLAARFHRIGVIEDALGILHWDQATMMPEGSAPARAEQVATLSVLRHELLTAPEIGDLLAASGETAGEARDDGNNWQNANLREMHRTYLHATAVPGDLVDARSRANAACELTWRSARADNDYQSLLPSLQEVLALTREVAAAKSSALGLSPYDALLDTYEPGARSTAIDTIFADLAAFLPDFLQRVLDSQRGRPGPVTPQGPFPVERQRALGRQLMRAVGFDFERGRLDVSHHPFCGGSAGDIRITTRYDETDFTSSLMGVLHETGHAMYEAGLPEAWRYQPVGGALGMAIHESQSLLIEMQVCRSRPFLVYAGPLMKKAFGGSGPAWDLENLYRLYTRVEPGFIRVDADEVTYPAHIILRYRLERALIGGDLVLADLPAAWNDGMKELLGIVPPDDRLGCLQDVHWPGGDFGYFPTYTMGAIAAAQLYAAARRDTPDVEANIAKGEFSPLMGWLGQHVHSQGSRVAADDLLTAATGAPLDPALFEQHLHERYLN
ncbi:MAG: carboxypeptidase M32 [Alphaproteobacteria bacterium]|nr:carboxypeptidase M32 [Alphaproteobacteria bacterium]